MTDSDFLPLDYNFKILAIQLSNIDSHPIVFSICGTCGAVIGDKYDDETNRTLHWHWHQRLINYED